MKKNIVYSIVLISFLFGGYTVKAQSIAGLLNHIDLGKKELSKVKTAYANGDSIQALDDLLAYFRNRTDVKHPILPDGKNVQHPKSLSSKDQMAADNALQHRFKAHKGYPFYFYGKDIDWQLWPVKDNELRWQLHRMYWWQSLAVAYDYTKDEKYAKEWMAEYRDWIRKNPLGLSADNDSFAWRPLEVSERLESQIEEFIYFVHSKFFDSRFLLDFLSNYYAHADYQSTHFAERGNHLLFESQRLVYAGVFFPEFKDAGKWVKTGIANLQQQINVQVYGDGIQNELSFNYHISVADIFNKAIHILAINGRESVFDKSFVEKVQRMMHAVNDFSFPDYTYPRFSDASLVNKSGMIQTFRNWQAIFPQDKIIQYNVDGKPDREQPAYTSKAYEKGGVYIFRNGWDTHSTVMVLKASPPAFWHSQPDNGTFELYHNGRNFFPDAGFFVYGGDSSVLAQRNWFKQTKLHNTLTLNNENINVDVHLLQWSTSDTLDALVYENPSYPQLTHRRSVYFVDRTFFVLVDEAIGKDTGTVALHFALKEGKVSADTLRKIITTDFPDNNNILIQNFVDFPIQVVPEENYVSYAYREKIQRPAFAFKVQKNNASTIRYITVIYPVTDKNNIPDITAKFITAEKNAVDAQVTIGNKIYRIGYKLK